MDEDHLPDADRIDLPLESHEHAIGLFGRRDEHLKLLADAFRVKIVTRGDVLSIRGSFRAVKLAVAVAEDLLAVVRSGKSLAPRDVKYALRMARNGAKPEMAEILRYSLDLGQCVVRPRTSGQKNYLVAMDSHDVVFATGPAGTGKTWLAVAKALADLQAGRVNRIVLTRPVVEAGENLGFLPGDVREKVNPYFRPIHDAMFEMIGPEKLHRREMDGIIEIAPLAYMRGRTLNDAFVILDEAQNTTRAQMIMFLSRLGVNSKAVITGDATQVDLAPDSLSGLVEAIDILRRIRGVRVVALKNSDIVRHGLVSKILKAFERSMPENRRS